VDSARAERGHSLIVGGEKGLQSRSSIRHNSMTGNEVIASLLAEDREKQQQGWEKRRICEGKACMDVKKGQGERARAMAGEKVRSKKRFKHAEPHNPTHQRSKSPYGG